MLCELLLSRGEKVVATARKPESIADLTKKASADQLLILPLDVTQKDQIQSAVNATLERFGKIDVLVNNAGYGTMGALEEVSEEEIRAIFETNVFGLFEMTRAVLPTMRKQKSGHIINLSSVAGFVALAGAGVYASTKFAIEGHSEALAGEVASFGIKVTLLQPGSFRTDFANRSIHISPYSHDYDDALATTRKFYETIGGNQPGDPQKAVEAIYDVVKSKKPPLRLPLGNIAYARVQKKISEYQKEMDEWKPTILGSDFPDSTPK